MEILRTYTRALLLLAVGLTAVITLLTPIRTNFVHLLVSNAYASRFSSHVSINMLRQALLLSCDEISEIPCNQVKGLTDEEVLASANDVFLNNLGLIQIITNSVTLPAHLFNVYGTSEVIPPTDTSESMIVLYGPGYLQLHTFFIAPKEGCWELSVQAQHDSPAPVNLAIWLDNIQLGTLSFANGDQSWDDLSVYVTVTPNSHWLRINFVNDFLDEQTRTDRNAYIRSVSLNPIEEARCESN